MQQFDDLFNHLQSNFKKAMSQLPALVGNEVVNFSKERFQQQNWIGDSRVEPWAKRKRFKKKRDEGRAILVKSARLKRSIRVTQITGDMVAVGTDVPYARIHNEGFKGQVTVKAHIRKKSVAKRKQILETVKGVSGLGAKRIGPSLVRTHGRRVNMPKRQFLGNSQYMVNRLKRSAGAFLLKKMQ